MLKRTIVSLCLALLAASIPPIRAAVLNYIGAGDLLPGVTSAGGFERAARAFD